MPRKLIVPEQVAKRLIDEVKVRECLWNSEHNRYNNRYKMARAWTEIAEELKMPEDRLRIKWKNLRDLFKKEVKKFGPVDEYSGKWRHFQALTFLKNPESDRTSEQNEENDSNSETKQEIETEDYEPEGNDVEIYYDEAYEDPLPDKKRKLSVDDDYDVMFLKSLAPYFKQLDPIRKLVVRSKMQDMLLNEIAAQSSASQFQLRKQS